MFRMDHSLVLSRELMSRANSFADCPELCSYLQTGKLSLRARSLYWLFSDIPSHSGNCGFNGDRCTFVETTLRNPPCPGCGSSTDISLIPP